MMPRAIRPNIAPSASNHKGVSDSDQMSNFNTFQMERGSNSLKLWYKMLEVKRLPNLPEVDFYDSAKDIVYIRMFKLSMNEYEESLDLKSLTKSSLGLHVGKFILDLLIAAYYVHNEGFVCGTFEPAFIAFDGLFWHVNFTPRICTIEEARSLGKPKLMNEYSYLFHKEESEHSSQSDDLYGVAFHGFGGRLRTMIWECDEVPLFNEFVKQSYYPMTRYDNVDVDAVSLLLNSVPAFNVMIEKCNNSSIFQAVLAAHSLANRTVSEILSKRRSFIETQPILPLYNRK